MCIVNSMKFPTFEFRREDDVDVLCDSWLNDIGELLASIDDESHRKMIAEFIPNQVRMMMDIAKPDWDSDYSVNIQLGPSYKLDFVMHLP